MNEDIITEGIIIRGMSPRLEEEISKMYEEMIGLNTHEKIELDKRLLNECICHWDRMINYVKKIPNKEEHPAPLILLYGIGESWGEEHCSLCTVYGKRMCIGCPLFHYGEWCCDPNSTWAKVHCSMTWKKWLIHAKMMVKVLKKCLKKAGKR